MKETAVVKEFSRFAQDYNAHNIIQEEVAKDLVALLPSQHYELVLDIGCGTGAVFKYMQEKFIDAEQFIALDSSSNMLDLHPTGSTIQKLCTDFNTNEAFTLMPSDASIILSASALQWSQNLDFTFRNLAQKSTQVYFAIFTSDTFKEVHKCSGAKSPIYSAEKLEKSIEKYYNAVFERKRYKLHFSSVREMFRYIKKSGVSGGEKQLSYKETKQLMDRYPLDYLEFEVLFVRAEALT